MPEDFGTIERVYSPWWRESFQFLHQARTICRRAERLCVALSKTEPVDPQIIKFINRLSDTLFVLARWVAKTQGEPEFLWERNVATKST